MLHFLKKCKKLNASYSDFLNSINKSQVSFGFLMSSAFQYSPYIGSGMHFMGLKMPKTKFNMFCGTPCSMQCVFILLAKPSSRLGDGVVQTDQSPCS